MTAILASCGDMPTDVRDRATKDMVAAMRGRGGDLVEEWAEDGVLLATGFSDWEQSIGGGAKGLAVLTDRCVVASDASLYYLDSLSGALKATPSTTPWKVAEAIGAAYLEGGEDWLRLLEGDFAFVLWDRSLRRLVAARGISGRRSLYFSSPSEGLVLASTIGGVLQHPWVSEELDLDSIVESAAYMWGHSRDTSYKAIKELLAGEILTWTVGNQPRVRRFWTSPRPPTGTQPDTDDAAEELIHLLTEAVDRRMAQAGPTAVSLSGGWDSGSVFGAGQEALRRRGGEGNRRLRPVSVSYPEGNRAREDELIEKVAAMWNEDPHWVRSADLSVITGSLADASKRSQAWVHLYEGLNRGVARGTREIGSRVVLDGGGGDELFQTSPNFLTDLVRRGRLGEAYRQWRAADVGGPRGFVRWALLQVLPRSARERLHRMGVPSPIGAPWRAREPAPWFRQEFLERRGIMEREEESRPRLHPRSSMWAETEAYKLFPFFGRAYASTFSFALVEGVEARSPLQDARIVEFAFHRPWFERADLARNESKVLLRRAMKGLLPADVLAPRTTKTGLTGEYLRDNLFATGEGFMQRTRDRSPLSEAGIIDTDVMEQVWARLRTRGNSAEVASLFLTLLTDEWLRARPGGV